MSWFMNGHLRGKVRTTFINGQKLYQVDLLNSQLQSIFCATQLTLTQLSDYLSNKPQILYCDNNLSTSVEGFHTDVYIAVSSGDNLSNGYRIRNKDFMPSDLDTYANSTDPLLQDLNFNGIVEAYDPSVSSITVADTTLSIGSADVAPSITWAPGKKI